MLRTLSCLPPSPPPFGIANAKLAYQQYKALFHGERWDDLAARGATAQRCLWASTSVKDPSLCDTLYVEELIGPDTISTMPEQTIRAFQDHGRVELRLESDLDGRSTCSTSSTPSASTTTTSSPRSSARALRSSSPRSMRFSTASPRRRRSLHAVA
jgi:transaldolase